jgi:hypothetical protein
MERQCGPADGIDALVDAPEPAVLHTSPDRLVAQPDLEELRPGDDSMLPLGKRHEASPRGFAP